MDGYNWNNLNIGDHNLNHSEGYFAFQHSQHEKFSEELFDNKENVAKNDKNEVGKFQIKSQLIKSKLLKETVNNTDALDKKLTTTNSLKVSENLLKTATINNGIKKVLQNQQPPSAYRYKEIYENKRERMLNKMLEDDKKKRQFHSRPAPNFKVTGVPEIKPIPPTMATTPVVLKKTREVQEIRRKKLEELLRQEQQQQKLCAREAKVLREEPFVPKKQPHSLQIQPFKLSVEKRLEERKLYDQCYNQKLIEKKVQQEKEQRIRDENLVKELKKLTTFRARPNPFK